MRIATGLLNLLLGGVYTSYGVMTIVDMKRGWRTLGFTHFGAAWITMAFTCGPHHLFHGIHALFEGRPGGWLDVFVVLVGLPAGVTWFLLRLEAFNGGRGDRFIRGTPAWVASLPTLSAVYLTVLGAATLPLVAGRVSLPSTITPNLLLIVLYCMIGFFLARTQLQNRRTTGGWSLSGLSLAFVFPTCAIMHGVFALYTATGRYAYDIHAFGIDWVGVPAATYFLLVVRGLYRDSLRDWNVRPAPAAAALKGDLTWKSAP